MSNFFDDSDEGEYNPSAAPVVEPEVIAEAAPEAVPEAVAEVVAEAVAEAVPEAAAAYVEPVAEMNPYQAESPAEYNPYQQPEAVQPEAAVEQYQQPAAEVAPEQMSSEPVAQANSAHLKADASLEEATMKTMQMMNDINQVNQVTDSSGVAEQTGFEDQENAENIFSVREPTTTKDAFGSVVKYRVTGQDSEGKFEIMRRYKEFDALYKTLIDRWPGCYIPAIPEKVLDNKDSEFVELRRSLLERFLRECSKYEYLIESKEMKIFTRGVGEVDGQLYKIPRQSASQILEKYRLNFQSVTELGMGQSNTYDAKINEFSAFITKSVNALNKERVVVEKMKQAADLSYGHYKAVYQNFSKYEHAAMDFFSDNTPEARVMTHPSEPNLENEIREEINTLKNPWAETLVWLKGELLDTQGMVQALKGRDKVKAMQTAAESRKLEKQGEVDKLVQGKTTLKSFWKSKSGKESDILKHQATIEQCTADVTEFQNLIAFINTYHGALAIDKFKRTKAQQYMKMVNLMAVREIHNSYHLATMNQKIIQIKTDKSV